MCVCVGDLFTFLGNLNFETSVEQNIILLGIFPFLGTDVCTRDNTHMPTHIHTREYFYNSLIRVKLMFGLLLLILVTFIFFGVFQDKIS